MELVDIAAVIIIISVLVGAAYLIYLATKDTKEILSIHDYKPNSEKILRISDSDQIVQSQLADTFEKCHDATLCLGLGPCEAEDENGFAWSNVIGYQKFIGRDVYQTQEKYYPIGFYKPGVLSFLSQFSRFEPIDLMPYWEKAQNKTQWKPSNEKVVDLLNLGALSAS